MLDGEDDGVAVGIDDFYLYQAHLPRADQAWRQVGGFARGSQGPEMATKLSRLKAAASLQLHSHARRDIGRWSQPEGCSIGLGGGPDEPRAKQEPGRAGVGS